MLKFTRPALLLFLAGVFLLSCKKKDGHSSPPPPPPVVIQPPTFTSFVVTDYCSRRVTITGTNFNPDAAKDTVLFGSVMGIVDSASATQLIARYPAGNPSGNIVVRCNGRTVTSTQTFSIPPISISSFTPVLAGPGALVTITGQNFDFDMSHDSVFFNGTKAELISVTPTQIIARVPQGPVTGVISVFVRCQSVSSAASFTFLNKGVVYISANSGITHAIDISSGTVIWTSPTNARFGSGPTYSNGVVYAGSSDVNDLSNNYMYALDALTGKQLWRYKAGPFDCIPAIDNNVLYAGAIDKNLYALNATTGQKIWSYTASDYFRSASPTYYNGRVYSRNDDSYFYCIDAATGNLVWRLSIWPGANPAAVNGVIYTAASGMLYALDAATGATIWTKQIQYLIGSSPTIVNGVLYIAAEDHQIYALNAATGAVIWKLEASWWVASAVYVVNNRLYVHSGDGVIGAVDATTSAILWSRALPASFITGTSPVVVNGVLYVGDSEGTLYALNASTGATIWTVNTGGLAILSSPCVVDQNGTVYLSGDSGNWQ